MKKLFNMAMALSATLLLAGCPDDNGGNNNVVNPAVQNCQYATYNYQTGQYYDNTTGAIINCNGYGLNNHYNNGIFGAQNGQCGNSPNTGQPLYPIQIGSGLYCASYHYLNSSFGITPQAGLTYQYYYPGYYNYNSYYYGSSVYDPDDHNCDPAAGAIVGGLGGAAIGALLGDSTGALIGGLSGAGLGTYYCYQ